MPKAAAYLHLVRQFFDEQLLALREETDVARLKRSFGYFSRHPVAKLNAARLSFMVDATRGATRILDLACGGGIVAHALAGHAKVLGLDSDPDEIRWANQFSAFLKHQPGDSRAEATAFVCTDLTADETWRSLGDLAQRALGGPPDTIVLAYALHHFRDPQGLLNRIAQRFPDASVLVNEENPSAPAFRLKHWVRGWLQADTDTEWHRSIGDWTRALQSAGYSRVDLISAADGLPLIGSWIGARWPTRAWSVLIRASGNADSNPSLPLL